MKKQDRQGVRTAADLERKYDFGGLGFGGTSEQVRKLTQTLANYMASTNATINQLTAMVKSVDIINTDGVYSLAEEYSLLKTAFDNGAHITLRLTMEDKTVKCYHCMGTVLRDEIECLLFRYGEEDVIVGSDESVVIE